MKTCLRRFCSPPSESDLLGVMGRETSSQSNNDVCFSASRQSGPLNFAIVFSKRRICYLIRKDESPGFFQIVHPGVSPLNLCISFLARNLNGKKCELRDRKKPTQFILRKKSYQLRKRSYQLRFACSMLGKSLKKNLPNGGEQW